MQDGADDETEGGGRLASPGATLALLIRRFREAAGLSQSQLANRVGYTRQYVSRAEQVSKGLPSTDLVAAIDREVGAAGALVAAHTTARRHRLARRAADRVDLGDRSLVAPSSTGVELSGVIDARRPVVTARADPAGSRPTSIGSSQLEQVSTDGAAAGEQLSEMLDPVEALEVVEVFTRSVVARYEIEGPSLLMPEVLGLRGVCRELGQRVGRELRPQVARAGARQAALLAYMLVNLDRHADAEAFAFEASMLATAADDRDLLAWVKGTQSFAAYYQGRYRDALRHAYAGLRIAGSGPQRARLLSNGVARAAGKLGEHAVVQRAVDEALELARIGVPGDSLSPCIAFEPYGYARTVANAATAFLSAGRYGTVLDLTSQLDDVVARSESDWSKALVRLDAASALARASGGDLDEAAAVGMQALAMSRTNPIASIGRRAGELAISLDRPGANARRADEFRDALHEWQEAADWAVGRA